MFRLIDQSDTPFRHWVLERTESLVVDPPTSANPLWVHYDNQCERRKRTCNDLEVLPPLVRDEVQCLCSAEAIAFLESLSGIAGLTPDLHGGGLHVTAPGGWLSPHLDYAIHPRLGLERRLNLIEFGGNDWPLEWGGAFELFDDEGREVRRRIYPGPGRVVVWEPGDTAFHGTQAVAGGAAERVTLAVYYLAAPRPGITRKRALFVPPRAHSPS